MNQEDIVLQKNAFLFTQLLLTLHNAAMQYLGKLIDPVSGKSTLNLEQARATIDMLDMLRSKCQGNLSLDEERFFDHILSDLKLNYVDETNRKPEAPPPE